MCLNMCFLCQLFFYKLARFFNDCGCFWLYSAPAPALQHSYNENHSSASFSFFIAFKENLFWKLNLASIKDNNKDNNLTKSLTFLMYFLPIVH